ncbi:16367_t:CDS:2, partial [Dentiscutata erythropus]
MTTKTEIAPEIISTRPELGELIERVVNVTNNALSPIVPMLGVVISLINEIFEIHENAQSNRSMSRSIINRMISVETAIKSWKSQIKCDEKFRDLQHQELFVKFQSVLKKIKITDDSIPQLDPILLKDPLIIHKSDYSDKLEQIIKKVYKGFIEVACKSRDPDKHKFRRELLILGKLGECQNIEKFYGLSKIDGKEVMIFEWVEMGNLREIYNQESSNC